MPTVGVVAIQGDFEKHTEALLRSGLSRDSIREVRTAGDLEGVDRLIIPGGESTTVGMLMERFGLGDAIRTSAEEGMPIWGTCMGMILMAKGVEGRPNQYSLNLLDIEVRRNAFGAQVHSFEDTVQIDEIDHPVTGVFIRAPIVSKLGKDARSICKYRGSIVAVRQGNRIGTSFHPELTDDDSMHRWFLSLKNDKPRSEG